MKASGFKRAAMAAAVVALSSLAWMAPASAATHLGKSLGSIQPPFAAHECMYFTLNGVAVADSLAGGSAWFALETSRVGYLEIAIFLMTVKRDPAHFSSINVATTGSSVCGGYAEVDYVYVN